MISKGYRLVRKVPERSIWPRDFNIERTELVGCSDVYSVAEKLYWLKASCRSLVQVRDFQDTGCGPCSCD